MFTPNELGIILSIILIIIIVLCNYTKYGKVCNDFFEPTTFYVILIVVFFMSNFASDFEFVRKTIYIYFIGSIAFIFGYFFNIKVSNQRKVRLIKHNVIEQITTRSYVFRTLMICLANIIVILLKLRSYGISFDEFIGNMMLLASVSKSGGYVWLILSYPLEVFNFLNIFAYVKNRKAKSLIVVILCQILISLSLFRTSRFAYIIALILLPLLVKQIMIDKKPKFNMKYIIICIMILPFMIVLNLVRHGYYGEINFGINELFEYTQDFIKGDTIPIRCLNDLVKYMENHNYYNYGKYFIYQVLSLIPRAIWKSKPITSFNFQATLDVFNKDPILGGTTYTFTVLDTYTVCGYFSLILGQAFLGWFSRKMYVTLYNQRANQFIWLFSFGFILNYINMLRASWMDMVAIYLFYFITNIVMYKLYVWFGRKKLIREN